MIGFLLFLIGTVVLFRSLGLNNIEINENSIFEYKWRLYYGSSLLALYMAGLLSCSISIEIIREYFFKIEKRPIWVFIIILILFGIVMLSMYDGGGSVGKDLRSSIANENINMELTNKLHINVELSNMLLKGFSALVIFLILISVAHLQIGIIQNESMIRKKTLQIRNSFYSSSVFLTFGVIEIFCLYS